MSKPGSKKHLDDMEPIRRSLILLMKGLIASMSWIRIALFNHRTEAAPLRQRLAQAGIRAEIRSEPAVAWFWIVSTADAGIRLEVPADQGGHATALLLDCEEEARLLRDAIRCPECRSLRVDYPQFTEKSFLPNLVIGLLAKLGIIEKRYYYEYCHFMWAKPVAGMCRMRGHMAPNYFLEGVEEIPSRQVAQEPGRRAA